MTASQITHPYPAVMRIGLLAASQISKPAMIDPAEANDRVEVAAVAARSIERAEAFAATHDIPVAYGSYHDLLADDSLDAIYVSTPASLHSEWSIAALLAGRHVLCEKPVAGNAAAARRMFETATEVDRVIMEGFHWRHHPFAERMIYEVAKLSRPVTIETEFSIPQIPRSNIRYQLPLGGGALMDLGCYNVHWVRTLLGEPETIEAEMETTTPGVDDTTTGMMRFADGSVARIRCSMSAADDIRVLEASASNGWVRADNPLHPYEGNRLAWEIDRSTGEEEVPGPTTFEAQLQSFVELVEDGGPRVVTAQDSIANMEVIDAMYRSAGLDPRP